MCAWARMGTLGPDYGMLPSWSPEFGQSETSFDFRFVELNLGLESDLIYFCSRCLSFHSISFWYSCGSYIHLSHELVCIKMILLGFFVSSI